MTVNHSPITIRRLTAEDAAAFRTLRLQGLHECPEAFTSSPEAEEDKPLAWFADILARELAYGCFMGDALCGTSVISIARHQPKLAHRGYLWGVYLDASARGQGAARPLMQAVLDAAAAEVELVTLGVGSHNAPAHRLYQSLGFRQYGMDPHALKIGPLYIDEILMMKVFDES